MTVSSSSGGAAAAAPQPSDGGPEGYRDGSGGSASALERAIVNWDATSSRLVDSATLPFVFLLLPQARSTHCRHGALINLNISTHSEQIRLHFQRFGMTPMDRVLSSAQVVLNSQNLLGGNPQALAALSWVVSSCASCVNMYSSSTMQKDAGACRHIAPSYAGAPASISNHLHTIVQGCSMALA